MIGARSNATTEYIFQGDPALDKESSAFDLKQYLRTFDRKFLPIVAGKTPTVFKIRRLPRITATAIAGLESVPAQGIQTVCYGLVGVENFMNGNGQPLVMDFVGDGMERRLTGPSMDALFSLELFGELMMVITKFGELDPLVDGRSPSSQP